MFCANRPLRPYESSRPLPPVARVHRDPRDNSIGVVFESEKPRQTLRLWRANIPAVGGEELALVGFWCRSVLCQYPIIHRLFSHGMGRCRIGRRFCHIQCLDFHRVCYVCGPPGNSPGRHPDLQRIRTDLAGHDRSDRFIILGFPRCNTFGDHALGRASGWSGFQINMATKHKSDI